MDFLIFRLRTFWRRRSFIFWWWRS